jgi:sugar lactone lactonase YvrE
MRLIKPLLWICVLAACTAVGSGAQTVSTLVPFSNFMGDGITVAPGGDIFVASGFGRPTVMKITPEGEVEQFAIGMKRAVGIALGPDGNFYVNNYGNGDISRITPEGEVSVWVSGLNGPAGIVFDAEGNALVSEFGANFSGTGQSVSRITPDGQIEDHLKGNGLRNPVGIALDKAGNLYVSNWSGGDIYRSRPGEELELFARIDGADINQIAHAGNYLYVPSPNLKRIYRIDSDGTVEVFAGNGASSREDGPALEASFSSPNGIAVSPDRRFLYVVEGDVGAIRRIELPESSTAVKKNSWGEVKAD